MPPTAAAAKACDAITGTHSVCMCGTTSAMFSEKRASRVRITSSQSALNRLTCKRDLQVQPLVGRRRQHGAGFGDVHRGERVLLDGVAGHHRQVGEHMVSDRAGLDRGHRLLQLLQSLGGVAPDASQAHHDDVVLARHRRAPRCPGGTAASSPAR